MFAKTPTLIATAVEAMTHLGSLSENEVPSLFQNTLHESVQPANANNVNTGPKAPQIIGLMLAQYNNHVACRF